MYSIMSLIGRDSTVEDATGTISAAPHSTSPNTTAGFTSSNAYVRTWKGDAGPHHSSHNKNTRTTHHSAANALLTELHEGYRTNRYKQVHGVLCFSLPKKKSSASTAGTSSASSTQGHNLMCTLHAYPIYASTEETPAAAAGSNNPSTSQIHALSSSKLALSAPHRNLVAASPMREFSLAGVNGASALDSTAKSSSGALSTQQAETPAALRRTTTQMSSQSFADTVRSTKRPTEPDVPRPVYYAILFHELSEQPPVMPEPPVVITGANTHTPMHPGSPPGGSSGQSAFPDTSGPHSVSGSPSGSGSGSGLSGALQALLPRRISRLFSNDQSADDREDNKDKYLRVSSVDDSNTGTHSYRTRSSGSSGSGGGSNNSGNSFSGPRATFYGGEEGTRTSREVRHYSTS